MLLLLSILPVFFLAIWFFTVKMPGRPFDGPLPPLTSAQQDLQRRLERHVERLAKEIGERSDRTYAAVNRAAAYIDSVLRSLGYGVTALEFSAHGRTYRNLEAVLPGTNRRHEVVVVGGHYDTAVEAPGADDNASGVAGVLELARILAGTHPARTIRFVAFANEEPPNFPTATMGSRHYADAAAARADRVVAMISVESIGYYATEPGTQRYPFPLNLAYPDRGDFIGFVGNLKSRALVRRAITVFRAHARFPSQGAAAPSWVPGVWWSDHWSFWRVGYPAIMITNTAVFRNPFYHTALDTPDKLDFPRMTRVVDGMTAVVRALAGG